MDIVKWKRTPHLAWSDGIERDDLVVEDLLGDDVVVTEKLDGECTTMTREFVHARSGDSADHPSRHYVKGLQASIGWRIPEGWYLVGENVAAVHSIYYPNVDPPYFYLFAVHDGEYVFSWAETLIVAKMLDLLTVPEIACGSCDTATLRRLSEPSRSFFGPTTEGFVLRSSSRIRLESWETHAAKYVRPNHVQTDEHWMQQTVRWNGRGGS